MSDQYFKQLNYTLANEDTKLEYELLEENLDHVLCVCGSGSRVLPLLARNPHKISLVDYSSEQIELTKLRLAILKQFNHEEFLQLLGYLEPSNLSLRKDLFHRLELPHQTKKYFDSYFQFNSWSPLIYQGQYEKALIKIYKIINQILGEKTLRKMQAIENQNEFSNFIENDFPLWRWNLILFFLGNSTFLNAILYKGDHPQKNISQSYFQYYSHLFRKLFALCTPQESFLIQMIFAGKIFNMKGAPFETNKEIYFKMQAGLKNCEIEFYQGELINIIENKISSPINFISFSDTLSYFPVDIENEYLQLIKSKLAAKAITVHRYYLRKHFNLNTIGYKNLSLDFQKLIEQEKTQIYDIEIYQREN